MLRARVLTLSEVCQQHSVSAEIPAGNCKALSVRRPVKPVCMTRLKLSKSARRVAVNGLHPHVIGVLQINIGQAPAVARPPAQSAIEVVESGNWFRCAKKYDTS